MLLAAAGLAVTAITAVAPAATATEPAPAVVVVDSEPDHPVTCTITAIGEAYDRKLWDGRIQVTGPGRLQCSDEPDTSDLKVCLMYSWTGSPPWTEYGFCERYTTPVTYKTVWDTAACSPGYFRIYVWHRGCHGNCVTKTDWSAKGGGVWVDCRAS